MNNFYLLKMIWMQHLQLREAFYSELVLQVLHTLFLQVWSQGYHKYLSIC